MVFLDAKSDIAFKKLFGDITHKKVLMSFLNNVLRRTERTLITDIIFNDPYNTPETPLSKLSISLPAEANNIEKVKNKDLCEGWVDVRCTDQRNYEYIVEVQVQVSQQQDYAVRAQYYSSLALSRQLASGQQYMKLVPVIFIGVLDFKLFKNPDYVSHHIILDDKTYEHELAHLEFYFIELAKFNKKEEEVKNILDKWIFLLKYADTLQKFQNLLRNLSLPRHSVYLRRVIGQKKS